MHEYKDTNVQEGHSNSDGFADRISELITEAGGYAEFARSCGVSESVARKWSKGGSDPSRSNLIAIAKARNVNLLWLATGEGEKTEDESSISVTVTANSEHPIRRKDINHGEPPEYAVKRAQTTTKEPPLDLQLLQEVIEALEAHLMIRGMMLTPARKALFIQLIYEHQMDKRLNKDETTERFLKLLDE
jgi:transcriptional regulator with XRE-family HTH domain